MTFLFEGVDVNFQPKVSNKLVYSGMPWNGFHICPLIVIRNNRNSDVTLKSVKFETIPAGVPTSVNTDFVIPSQTTGFYDKFRSDITKLRERYDIEKVKFTFTIEAHTIGTSTNSITIDVTPAKGLSFFGKKDDLGPGLFLGSRLEGSSWRRLGPCLGVGIFLVFLFLLVANLLY